MNEERMNGEYKTISLIHLSAFLIHRSFFYD